jgi:large subunit ribosomal protein L4
MEELVVVDRLLLKEGDPGLIKKILEQNKWGNEHLRSLLITEDVNEEMTLALKELGMEGRTLPLADVDVKDCLELGRLVIERGALDKIMKMRLPEELKPAEL